MMRYISVFLGLLGVYFLTLTMTSPEPSPPDHHNAVYVTVPNEEVAKKIAHGLVKEQLAACVNIIPKITSVYMWKGEINEDSELLLMIKTRTSRIEDLTAYVKANHPYEVCEVIAVPITAGNKPYLNWIDEVVPNKAKQ
ncbi:hypothetical protein R5R35_002600 [Gryllus longicercus]|uniref:Accessory gland protein n=1 Tax=Gryllus longicercus TaxID=2509291 RepID=A0AAN9VPN0_9ORTH